MRRGLVLMVLATGLALPAVAGATVTIVPPTPHHTVNYGNDTEVRVATSRPTFGIEGTSGVAATCTDNLGAGIYHACGPPLPGCHAALCASYQPAGSLRDGEHVLGVETLDSDGYDLDDASVDYIVDSSPPTTTAGGPWADRNLDATVDSRISRAAFRPYFSVAGNHFFDTVQCSLTRRRARAQWYPCLGTTPLLSEGGGHAVRVRHRLPHRHVDYVFRARAIDDFGRVDPTPATVAFDPVPCVVRTHAVSIGKLISTGLPVTLTCSGVRRVGLDLYFLGKNGHRRSVGYATNNYNSLGVKRVAVHRRRYTRHLHLRMFHHYDSYFRGYHSAALVIRASDAQDPSDYTRYAAYTATEVRR